jgi:ABC-type branched-subunit amino acid transport system substrate-binding protein
VISPGDRVAHIYLDGELGGNALSGSEYFAKQHGITLDPVKVLPTDADLTLVVTKLRGQKVDAIAISTGPAQTASIAAAARALKLNVPMIGTFVSFVPQLLTTPAAGALSSLYLAASIVPYNSTVPKAKAVRAAFEAAKTGVVPNLTVQTGYAFGEIIEAVLTRACANKDLTRDGIQAALAQSTSLDTQGLTPVLDYSKAGSPPSRESYVAQVDPKAAGGMRQLDKASVSADAQSYVAPHQQGN